jgi:hypothetical protein
MVNFQLKRLELSLFEFTFYVMHQCLLVSHSSLKEGTTVTLLTLKKQSRVYNRRPASLC